MHAEGFFYQAFIYLAAAVIAVPIARRLGLGAVLGYLIAGIIIGPFVLGLIGEEGKDIMHFAEFGVVMMLFLVGLELQPSLLWRMRGPLLGLGSAQVGLTALAVAGAALALGVAWRSAAAAGLILALSSTAIALQVLAERKLSRTDAGQNSFAVLLFQDLAVIPILAVLPLLAATRPHGGGADGSHHTWVSDLPGWAYTLVVIGVLGMLIVVGRFLARHLFRVVARSGIREIFTATALLLVIGIAILMAKVDLSPALGTFVAGVVLADNEYRHELESDIEPFKGLLLGLFFIAVGASIDFKLVGHNPGLVAGLVAGLIAIKLAVLFGLAKVFRMSTDQSLIFTFTLAQGGEFAFVLFSFAVQNGILTREITGPLTAVVAISMALTPLMVLANEKLLLPRIGTREQPEKRKDDEVEEANPVIITGFGRFGSVVGRFLRANGIGVTIFEADSDRVELLRKLGLKTYYGEAVREDLLVAAGAREAKLLILTMDDHEKILRVVESARKHFPQARIIARAGGRVQAYELLEAGVDHVFRETFDTALRAGVEALRLLDVPGHQAFRAARVFRKHDEEHLRELASVRHDKKAHINLARERINNLEKLMLRETAQEYGNADMGWDTTTLRREFSGTDTKASEDAP